MSISWKQPPLPTPQKPLHSSIFRCTGQDSKIILLQFIHSPHHLLIYPLHPLLCPSVTQFRTYCFPSLCASCKEIALKPQNCCKWANDSSRWRAWHATKQTRTEIEAIFYFWSYLGVMCFTCNMVTGSFAGSVSITDYLRDYPFFNMSLMNLWQVPSIYHGLSWIQFYLFNLKTKLNWTSYHLWVTCFTQRWTFWQNAMLKLRASLRQTMT